MLCRLVRPCVTVFVLCAVAGCASDRFIAHSGPSATAVAELDAAHVRVVALNPGVAKTLEAAENRTSLEAVFGHEVPSALLLGPGDRVEVTIWEAPPAVLLAPGVDSSTEGAGDRHPSGPKPTTGVHLPVQPISADGAVSVPFVGRVNVAGKTDVEAAELIRRRLQGLAHEPQVLVTVTENVSSTVTVVGSVNQTQRLPLSARGERILDAVASAGGPREKLERTTLQLSRAGRSARISLDVLVKEPRQNLYLQPGDVLSLYYQPLSFTALGATGRNEEISFEATGLTLAQALGRVNGLSDQRATPKGVFVFRQDVGTDGDGAPVVYRVDLTDPMAFWAIQHFPMHDRDILYVANAPSAEFEKFMAIVATAAYSLTNFGIKP